MSAAGIAPTAAVPAVPVGGPDFPALLAELRADCIRQHQVALVESATSVSDPVAVTRAARLHRRIGEIDAALQRIADGRYGSCIHCGSAIAPERLELRPFASGCVRCDGAR
jgi:DnaK suppressor protein